MNISKMLIPKSRSRVLLLLEAILLLVEIIYMKRIVQYVFKFKSKAPHCLPRITYGRKMKIRIQKIHKKHIFKVMDSCEIHPNG